jgi:hypothetical protein
MRLPQLWERGEGADDDNTPGSRSDDDDSLADELYQEESSQETQAEAGPSRRRTQPQQAGTRMGARELRYKTYRDHWNVMRARLVSRGSLRSAWGEEGSDIKLEDLPAATQEDGELLWW